MKLGILVNTEKHLDHIMGISHAAISKGHEVLIFVMDDGTKLLENRDFCALGSLQGVQMSYCRLGAIHCGVVTEADPNIREGSQYNNACMSRDSDKVIVL